MVRFSRDWTQYFAQEEKGLNEDEIAARRKAMREVIGVVNYETMSCLHTFPAGFVAEIHYPELNTLGDEFTTGKNKGRCRVLMSVPAREKGYRDLVMVQRTIDSNLFRVFFPSYSRFDSDFYGAGANHFYRQDEKNPWDIDFDAFLKEVGM
jgi:hypothetical protein